MKLKPVFILIILLFLSHTPFLDADPDRLVDVHTRGAWSDEGLYSAQARNFVHYGNFGLNDNTTFVRGPLFNIIQAPVFFVFGTSLPVARLITVFAVCLALFLLACTPRLKIFTVFVAILCFTHFRIFHFSHFAVAEIISISFVLISFAFLSRFFRDAKPKYLFLSAMMIFGTYSLKNQFFYFIVLLPAVVLIFDTIRFIKKDIAAKKVGTEFLYTLGFSVFFLLVYILIWYLPTKEFYDLVMFEQTYKRFQDWENLHRTLLFNYNYYLDTLVNLPILYGFYAAVFVWILSFFIKSIKITNHLIIIFGLMWLLIELHKLAMTYLPERYLLGLYASAAFFIAAVFSQLVSQHAFLKYAASLFLASALALNVFFNQQAYDRRTYEVKTINDYLHHYNWKNRTIAGVWAPTFTWGTKARVLPVWKNFTPEKDFMKNIAPTLVIAEPGERDSEGFFKGIGIDLASVSDSNRKFDLWRYHVSLFWMPPKD